MRLYRSRGAAGQALPLASVVKQCFEPYGCTRCSRVISGPPLAKGGVVWCLLVQNVVRAATPRLASPRSQSGLGFAREGSGCQDNASFWCVGSVRKTGATTREPFTGAERFGIVSRTKLEAQPRGYVPEVAPGCVMPGACGLRHSVGCHPSSRKSCRATLPEFQQGQAQRHSPMS